MSIKCFPDTQDKIPTIPVHLTRVGVSGVKKLLKIEREEKRPIVLLPTFDAFVDLPSKQRGIHMSRNPEAISDVLEEVVGGSAVEIESLCAEIVNRLLKKHKYARRAEVSMKSDLMVVKRSPVTDLKTQEMTNIMADATGFRDGDEIIIRKMIGAEVIGMTACPCAQESVRETSRENLLEFLDEETTEKVLDSVSLASHNQRGRGMIMIEVPHQELIRVEQLIKIIEESMSSSVCELLKRPDENAIVVQAHKNPMFVEDCVRNMVQKIVNEFKHFPDDTLVTVRQVNEESIHRHNAFAEKVATLGELKYEIEGIEEMNNEQ
ncbi:MAG: GTP cyclohydrolase I FolE2 [Methanobacterium sp.]|uniref:GTP cyclohydrolase MptA n=1 Tax=Methanobacterium sp. TaxID=2164 RepID=UPI003D654C61|nr:GTP cyclohydrolase I FolE2 [Methanobacterium sp.]